MASDKKWSKTAWIDLNFTRNDMRPHFILRIIDKKAEKTAKLENMFTLFENNKIRSHESS